MASNRIAGITVQIGADTTPLTKALSAVDKQLSSTQAQLKDVNKLLELKPGNVDLLRQKQQLLTDAIDQTKTRLQQLKEAQQNATDPKEYDALQREIIETEDRLESLTSEYKNFGSVAAQQVQTAGKKMQEVGNKISGIGSSLSTKLTLPIVAAFTAAGKSASDYEENLNKIDVAFGKSADEVKKWADSATEKFGLSKVAATEAAAGFGALAKGIGLAEQPAANVSVKLAGLSSDLASYFNSSTSESAKALEGIFTGEAEALKKFGVVMNDTNLEKFAADQGKVWKECSQTEKTMIRYEYVLSKTKDAQGDYSRTADGTANSFRTFQAALQNLATVIGRKLLPIITPVIQKVTEMIDKFSKMSPQMQELIVKIGLLVAAAGPVLQIVGPIITILGKLTSGIGLLMGKIAGAGGLTAALGSMGSAIGSAVAALGPMGIAIAAIVAAVAVAAVAIYKNWDKIKKWTKDMVKNVKQKWDEFKKAISKTWDSVKTSVTNGMNKVKSTVTAGWNSVKSGTTSAWNSVRTAVSNGTNTVRTAVSNGMNKAKSAVQSAWNSVKSNTSSAWSSIRSTISGAVSGVRSAASSGFSSIKSTASSAWSTIRSGASSALGNLRSLVSNSFSGVGRAITSPLRSALSSVKNVVSRIKSAFKFRISLPKIRLPHINVRWTNVGKFFRIPRLSIEWYKKAYDNPMLFNSPTVLQTPYGAKGFGDGNGGELVYGRNQLMRDIAEASGGMNVTFNITQQPGQDVNQLADAIQVRLARLQKQKGKVYA